MYLLNDQSAQSTAGLEVLKPAAHCGLSLHVRISEEGSKNHSTPVLLKKKKKEEEKDF